MRLSLLVYAIALLLSTEISGCQPSPRFDEVYDRVTVATLTPQQSLPQPEEDVILTVTGAIGRTNNGKRIVMDRSMIESVGLVEYDVLDPFENQDYLFQGVLMRDLLELWHVSSDATSLKITALDDYQVEVAIALFDQYPVLLALRQNGQYLERNYRGPAMLVFPLNDYHFDFNVRNGYWIWQIKSIVVQ
ncbi:MAG: molybdopterin-dependent oxidoreductase [Leptolyngbyaceae cyanobacterium]